MRLLLDRCLWLRNALESHEMPWTRGQRGVGQLVVTAGLYVVYLPGYPGRLAARYAGSHVPR